MTGPDVSPFDFNRAAARLFADRPTLRQVLSTELLGLLQQQLPWLNAVEPALPSADPLMLDSPDPDTSYWTTQPLVDRVLQALLQPQALDLEPLGARDYKLGLTGAYRFAGSTSEFDTRPLRGLSAGVNELITRLPYLFQQAQVGYWRGTDSSAVSRDDTLQLLLKTALLRNMPLQGLDEQERACIRGLLKGGTEQPVTCLVRARLTADGQSFEEMQPSLMVSGEWDDRQVLLCCEPRGRVSTFASPAAYALSLRDELAQRYRFDQMTWERYPVEGDAFAHQSALILDLMLGRIEQVRYAGLADIAALERLFAQLSDPAQWFDGAIDDRPPVTLPPGLVATSASNSSAYQAALLGLAVDQLDSQGKAALEDIQDLQGYASARLAEQMREVHGEACPANALMLQLYVARGVPGGAATGPGGGEPLVFEGEKSLAEFAIGNLSSLRGAVIKGFRRTDGVPVPKWLDADAAKQLVAQVDIGGTYPAYVARMLDDPRTRADRLARFAREWRAGLSFSALQARVEGKVGEAGLQCVVDFCAGRIDPEAPRAVLMPLTFRRQPQSRKHDRVRGMYVLYCAEPRLVLLYRPLYPQDTLREYPSLDALMAHIRTSTILSQSILAWLNPQVRPVYDNHGFEEPHVTSIGIDPYALPVGAPPAVFDPQFWLANLDERMYSANRDLLVELAGMQSTSNAESRWALLAEGAWLLFDVATLLLRGPVATVAWLVQLLDSLQADVQAIEQGDGFGRGAALVDMLLNLGMSLLHARLPPRDAAEHVGAAPVASFEGRPAQRGAFSEMAVRPVTGEVHDVTALAGVAWQQLDLSWRGTQGMNWLPPSRRAALRAMRSSIALNGRHPVASGDAQGLYLIDGEYYAALAGEAYRVEVSAQGVRVIDGLGEFGPWLAFCQEGWRVDAGLRLRAGTPPASINRRLLQKFEEMRNTVSELEADATRLTLQFSELGLGFIDRKAKVERLQGLITDEQSKLSQLPDTAEHAQARSRSIEILERYQARVEQWRAEQLTMRDQSIQRLEQAVGSEKQVAALLDTMLEPKYGRAGGGERLRALQAKKTDVQLNLIRNYDFIAKDLQNMADYPRLDALHTTLERLPFAQGRDAYLAYRQALDRVVSIQERMLSAHENLDVLLAQAPRDLPIPIRHAAEPRTVATLIAQRTFSVVQLRFHQAMNLAELGLRLDSKDGQRALAGYRADLTGTGLRNAANAHGQIVFANLSSSDLVAILQEAWDEYAAALVNCARILRQGGALIEAPMLRQYQVHLQQLKEDAGRHLVEAIKWQDEGVAPTPHPAYPVTAGAQRAVRNADGQIMVANEVTVDGVAMLQVREPITGELLLAFENKEGEWREVESPPPSPPAVEETLEEDTAMRVQALLDESEQVLTQAQDYVSHDIKGDYLKRLFDAQIAKLAEAASPNSEATLSEALTRQLEARLDRLRLEKTLMLTRLYTDTRYPSAESLRFLHEQRLIKVEYVGPRRTMANGSAFDEYKIMRLADPGDSKGRNLWAAHMHLPSGHSMPRDFTIAHLKTWRQRQLSDRQGAAIGQRVHRGRLTLEQAQGIIPFD
ncbi:hypothetical protein P0Y43_25340 [Pseudomonas entomophila]|uniref:DUF6543 domain-containing protein n=1 Tax=Pseudomonas entomophila TaxID=312306 RepID=UPI0023D8C93C|nr:DUF6543 domain-containing protein [Pseudomonas entomophila]MDF0734010.1 hypothetical protein [Pseudomonas entomophila]